MKSTLVSTAELAGHPAWRVFDCRHDLMAPDRGRELYAHGHIPGALHAHLDRDLSAAQTGHNGRHPLPEPAVFARWLERCGVRNSDQVVAYDDASGAIAARLWWMLRWLGHDAVAVLDGGFAAWTREGRPVSTTVPTFAPSSFTFDVRGGYRVGVEEVESSLKRPTLQVLDARAADRFEGRNETIDPVAGHIPGARNRPFARNLEADGTFKSPDALRTEWRAELGELPPERIVHQCGSGVTACHNLLAMEHAGLTGSRLYAGSWSEWSSDPSRPVSTGA